MYSLSSSWNSSIHKTGRAIIDEIKAAGFDTVELNFALTEEMVSDILSMKEAGAIKVSSLHNICPLPKDVEPDESSPDYYSLASPDADERRLAVEVTKNTVDYARKFGATAVVLHTGRVQMKDRTRDLAALAGDRARFDIMKGEMISQRCEKRGEYLASAMKSLAELVPYAKERLVRLGVENRYYYREIPLADELDLMFRDFKEDELGYWHDTGHAEVFERLGLARHRDLLDKFSNRLIGIHLHDIIGLIKDHQVPGLGTFDFKILKPYIRKEVLKVIEAHRPATADELRHSVEYLTEILG